MNRPKELFHEICQNTLYDSIEFSTFSYGELLVQARTIIRGKLVKIIWKIERNLNLSFVTLIPGGVK